MIAYLDDGWIYKRLEAADKIVFLRKYRQEDGILLVKLFYETINRINIKDYTEEQVSAWATGKIDLEKWDQFFLAHYSIVAVDNDVIVGFGDIGQSSYLFTRIIKGRNCHSNMQQFRTSFSRRS